MTASRILVALLVCGGWSASGALAQAPAPGSVALETLASGDTAHNRAVTVSAEGGRTVAAIDARAGFGGVRLGSLQLGEGVIELELKGKDVFQRSFIGVAFHMVDWTTFDAVYFRPFNFRAEDPVRKSHAVQYVSHPVNTWQRLRAERPGQFEQGLEPPPDPNDWFRARIVLGKGRVEVYVNGATTPSLSVDDLGEAKSGGLALWVGEGSDGFFANVTVTPTVPAK